MHMVVREALTAACAAPDGVDIPPVATQVKPKACADVCCSRAKPTSMGKIRAGFSDHASLLFEAICDASRVSKRPQRAGEMFRQHISEVRGLSGAGSHQTVDENRRQHPSVSVASP